MKSLENAKQKRLDKYKTILDNLLDIKNQDRALFTRVDNLKSFDIITKFGDEVAKKLFEQAEFSLSLDEQDLPALREAISLTNDVDEIVEILMNFNYPISKLDHAKLLKSETFSQTYDKILNKVDEKIQKQKLRWQTFIRHALDENVQSNIWPIHIATLFVKVKTARKVILAPLLLREVFLSFDGLKLKITDQGDWKLNEKLLFVLGASGFVLNEKLEFKDISAHDAIDIINKEYALNEINHLASFSQQTSHEIDKPVLEAIPGFVLGLFHPSGSNLRQIMQEIIDHDELDEIINPDFEKSTYEKSIDNFLNESGKILRIQNSNFSQDKAVISSLCQDTIIWGPPGSGKSQVIANLIANIMHKNDRAIVMSQKKAALDVLKHRLGSLSKFALFLLNDNKMLKDEFYKPLEQFVHALGNAEVDQTWLAKQISQKDSLIDEKTRKKLLLINDLKTNDEYQNYLEMVKKIPHVSNQNLETIMENFQRLDPSIKIPLNSGFTIDDLASFNQISKKGLFVKKYPKPIVETYNHIHNLKMMAPNFDVSLISELISKKLDVTKLSFLTTNAMNEKTRTKFKTDELLIESTIIKRLHDQIKQWRDSKHNNYELYQKFANSVRAGRRIPYKFLKDHSEILQALFPIIITTPEATFFEWKKGAFKYAILDESSQIFIEVGIPILYLGKIKILAGDPMQMKPSRWFAARAETLDGESEVAEDAESLLDYGREKGMYEIILDKNYRANHAALMSFSAKEFYRSELDVLDHVNSANSPIEVYNLNGKWEDGINKLEAEKCLKYALHYLNDYEKIIILTFNAKQKDFIWELIISNFPVLVDAITNEKVSLRNIENIQGDEADLIIVSVVYDPSTNISSTYVARPGGRNALNVAISRARDKMVIFKSITSNNVKVTESEDFFTFKNWLEFLDLNDHEKRIYSIAHRQQKGLKEDNLTNFQSDVLSRLKTLQFNRDLEFMSNFEVGSKVIPYAFVDKETKHFVLGLILDEYDYLQQNQRIFQNFLSQQAEVGFFESKGYQTLSISELEWFVDNDSQISLIQAYVNSRIKQIFK